MPTNIRSCKNVTIMGCLEMRSTPPLCSAFLHSIRICFGTGDVQIPVEESRGGADYRDAGVGGYAAAATTGRHFQADQPMRLGDLLTHMQQGGAGSHISTQTRWTILCLRCGEMTAL